MRHATSAALLAAATLAAACGDGESKAAETRFSGVENYSIDYGLTGSRSGTKTIHSRDWGRVRVEIDKTSLSVMGIVQKSDKRTIIEGAEVTTIDEQTKTVSRMTNPMYDRIAASLEGKDPEEVGREFMRAMGHKPAGRTGSYAGEECEFWTNAQLAQELCVTSDGLVLYTATNMMGISMTETATSVRRGDPGPGEAYEVPDYPVRDVPNLQELMKGRGG